VLDAIVFTIGIIVANVPVPNDTAFTSRTNRSNTLLFKKKKKKSFARVVLMDLVGCYCARPRQITFVALSQEGLLATVTVSLTLCAKRMAKKHVLVKVSICFAFTDI
jgi:hypothetical protein